MAPHKPLLLVFLFGFQAHHCGRSSAEESTSNAANPPEYEISATLYAICRMRPNAKLSPGQPKVYGQVLFKQVGPDGKLEVAFNLNGFQNPDSQLRAIHIHQYGDLSEGCTSTGGHYNPNAVNHPGHPGDFGNFASRSGKVRQSVVSRATLFGGLSALGRAVVIHEKLDDMGLGGDAGSLLHGNAGGRLGCCVIGISTSKVWDRHQQKQQRRLG